jgi:hypothetical protein
MSAPATAKQGAKIASMEHLARAELLALYRDGTRLERDAARRELDRRRTEPRHAPARAVRCSADDWRRRQAGDA